MAATGAVGAVEAEERTVVVAAKRGTGRGRVERSEGVGAGGAVAVIVVVATVVPTVAAADEEGGDFREEEARTGEEAAEIAEVKEAVGDEETENGLTETGLFLPPRADGSDPDSLSRFVKANGRSSPSPTMLIHDARLSIPAGCALDLRMRSSRSRSSSCT